MAEDPLESILRLVAEGRLTADEAAPILAALEGHGVGRPPSGGEPGGPRAGSFGAGSSEAGTGPSVVSTLRIEVRDGSRSVLNLRLPIAAGRFALDRVPGLSGDQVDRVREALRSGQPGTILEVDEHTGNGVRIVLE